MGFVPPADADSLVEAIESALHEHHVVSNNDNKEYANQVRSLKSNLHDKKNMDFNRRVLSGEVEVAALATMSSAEMASDSKKGAREKMRKEQLEACQSDWDMRNVKVSCRLPTHAA